ncbi:MAG: DUF4124 domain-containing protein [Gammaproteobacteria bacterium]|nr:DUF4124 domain-containing protein [Gammaproteobacteria bacterium]MCF6362989.1 DUF4124 domain-containing protein [Gammaproteobacteria bacterium]
MKLPLALLLLVFPLISAAAAYQWVDENGNVRFGSKPKAEKSEPAAKTTPKVPAKKPEKTTGEKTMPDRTQPSPSVKSATGTVPVDSVPPSQWVDENGNVRFGSKPKAEKSEPAAKTTPKAPAKKPEKPTRAKTMPDRTQPATTAPKIRRSENPLLSTQPPPHVKPAAGTIPVDSVPPSKPEPAKPVLQAIPTPKPARAPKVKAQPTPTSAQRASKPPVSQPAGATHKPAQKKPTPKKAIEKKTPTAKSAAPETETNTEKNAELCGIFTNFASNWQNKLINCQGASCSIYEKSLINYQEKQKTYCR